MKTIAAFVLGLGIIGSLELLAQEKKEDKKEEKKEDKKDDKKVEPPVLDGKYKLVAGKISDKAIGDDAKKWEYTFSAGKITIRNFQNELVRRPCRQLGRHAQPAVDGPRLGGARPAEPRRAAAPGPDAPVALH